MLTSWTVQSIPGLYRVGFPQHSDTRGTFHKILANQPQDQLPFRCDQVYWSRSQTGVARGMHLQLPPFEGRKLVFLTSGRVRDFVLDLRVGSPTYHEMWSDELTPESEGIFIPAGCAHGFVTLQGEAAMVYAQEGDHDIDYDSGVNMSGLDLGCAMETLIFSKRDQMLPMHQEFLSPFTYSDVEL